MLEVLVVVGGAVVVLVLTDVEDEVELVLREVEVLWLLEVLLIEVEVE